MANSNPLEIRELEIRYGDKSIIANFNLTVRPGQIVALVGQSGSGKTSILNSIIGLIQPYHGEIIVDGLSVDVSNRKNLSAIRSKHVGVVFQGGELIGELNPIDNIALPALIAKTPKSTAYRRAELLLTELGVPSKRTTIQELSGGERQRVALARSLVNNPALVIADEPTAALDYQTRDSAVELLFKDARANNRSVLIATHDQKVWSLADAIVELS
jgi:ABC-type lipoprotein export system ATPase subunit